MAFRYRKRNFEGCHCWEKCKCALHFFKKLSLMRKKEDFGTILVTVCAHAWLGVFLVAESKCDSCSHMFSGYVLLMIFL